MAESAWSSFPVLEEFHAQWWKNRGRKLGTHRTAFWRNWETLLEDAGLKTAELRREAERDIRELAKADLLQIKTDRSRPHIILRIGLPLDQETRLAELFQDPIESKPTFDPGTIHWEPEVAFLTTERVQVAPEDLLAINHFFQQGGRERPLVPIKERSLTIFGNEKRLDQLLVTSLFDQNRLTLGHLRAYYVPEPLGWRRGDGPSGHCLIVENAATWESFCRYNQIRASWSAVIYGAGHRCIEGSQFLATIAQETGAIQSLDYFGDVDAEGLRIPVFMANRCRELGFPGPQPLEWAYQWLLENGHPAPAQAVVDPAVLDWLPSSMREAVGQLLRQGQRIAQEHLGWEHLQ